MSSSEISGGEQSDDDSHREVLSTGEIYEGPPLTVPDDSMGAWFERIVEKHGDRTAALVRSDDGDTPTFESYTYAALGDEAREIATGLLASGLSPGDRLAVQSETRYEWSVLDLACYLAGIVLVPVYPTFSPGHAAHVIEDAGADVLVSEEEPDPELVDVVADVYRFDTLPTESPGSEDFPGLDVDADEAATIIYTSGTTGEPKGCVITHRNLRSATAMVCQRLPVGPDDVGTCFLPLSHIYQRLTTYMIWNVGASTAFMTVEGLKDELSIVEPSILVTVPRVYRRMYDGIQGKIDGMSPTKQRLMRWADTVAREYGEALSAGNEPTAGLRAQHALADRLVYSKLRDAAGLANVRYAITGAASMDPDLLHFFWGLGIRLCEVYGATETTGPVTFTKPDYFRAGTVGQPSAGTKVTLADDGEVLFRGPNVLDRYWGDDEATEEAFIDGWYRTGDIGAFDDDGFLTIVDRRKRMAVLDTGKNVSPSRIETALTRSQYIEEAMAIANDRKFVTALVQPNFDALVEFATEEGIASEPERDTMGETVAVSESVIEQDVIRELYEREVARANEELDKHEQVGAFELIARQFSVEDEELTPTLKKREDQIMDVFGEQIDAMYAES